MPGTDLERDVTRRVESSPALREVLIAVYRTQPTLAELCERLGLEINVAGKIAESSIASAATVHLACAVPSADWGVSLTHFYLADDLVRRPLPLAAGTVALPDGPGLGVEVDEAAVARFRVR